MNVVDIKIKDLKAYENNPRDNSLAIDCVAESIKDFGFKVPIVVDKDNVIIAGHTRLEAAKKLRMKVVPCIIADDLTPEQVRAFRIADNKVAELAAWDYDKLREELCDIKDYDLTSFGFSECELDLINDTTINTIDRRALVEDEYIDVDNTYIEPKKSNKSKIENDVVNDVIQSVGRIQCPNCGEFFELTPNMIRGD